MNDRWPTAVPRTSWPPLRPFESAAWRLLRTGPGRTLAGAVLLLLVAAALAMVLEPHWRLRAAELDAGQGPARVVADTDTWPDAAAHAARVSSLLGLARRHDLTVRSLREDAASDRAGTALIEWRPVGLSAEGRYGDLRAFTASALASDPALALDSLVLQRAELRSGVLRAEFGFALAHSRPAVAAEKSR